MVTKETRIRIGELARSSGLSPDTLRHYERLKLLRAAGRTRARYRIYGPEALVRVRVIQAALSLGFTLAELAPLLGMRDAGKPPCRSVRALAADKLEKLERHLEDVLRLRRGLRRILKSWDARLEATPTGGRAGLLDALVSGEVELDLPVRTPVANLVTRRNTK